MVPYGNLGNHLKAPDNRLKNTQPVTLAIPATEKSAKNIIFFKNIHL